MWNKLLLLFVLAAAAPALAGERVILVLGDSLSSGHGIGLDQGWVALLRQRLQEKGYDYRVVNASISGETTRSARSRLDTTLERYHPDLVIVELGGNDGLRGLPLERTRGNLRAIVDNLRARDINVLLVGVRLPPNYGPDYTRGFQETFAALSRRADVALVPFLLAGIGEHRALMQADGIHPRAEAQPRMLENVWEHLEPLLTRNGQQP